MKVIPLQWDKIIPNKNYEKEIAKQQRIQQKLNRK